MQWNLSVEDGDAAAIIFLRFMECLFVSVPSAQLHEPSTDTNGIQTISPYRHFPQTHAAQIHQITKVRFALFRKWEFHDSIPFHQMILYRGTILSEPVTHHISDFFSVNAVRINYGSADSVT